MSRCLVLAEQRKGGLREVTLEALAAARQLGAEEIGVVLACDEAAPATELARFAARVMQVGDPRLAHHEPVLLAETMAALARSEEADRIVLPHSYHGMDLAGRLAAGLGWQLVTDVTGIAVEGDRVVADRMLFGGRVQARVALPAAEPLVISVRPTAFAAASALESAGEVAAVAAAESTARGVRFIEYVEEASDGDDITQADIVVAVGRGVGEEENIGMVAELAEALGGVLACSRPVVDRGWLSRSRQVGTSGKTIRPRVYVAVGISGAFQHVAGMRGAGRVIAVNRDPHAPIFKAADYGIVGDLFTIVPELTRAARERKG